MLKNHSSVDTDRPDHTHHVTRHTGWSIILLWTLTGWTILTMLLAIQVEVSFFCGHWQARPYSPSVDTDRPDHTHWQAGPYSSCYWPYMLRYHSSVDTDRPDHTHNVIGHTGWRIILLWTLTGRTILTMLLAIQVEVSFFCGHWQAGPLQPELHWQIPQEHTPLSGPVGNRIVSS